MLRRNYRVASVAILLSVVLMFFFVIENRLTGDDDFLPKKEEPRTSDIFAEMQKKMDSMMKNPFFQDPSLDNIRGFDLFDRNLNDQFDRMFKGFSPGFGRTPMSMFGNMNAQSGQTDIREIDDQLVVIIDLPGHDKSSIDLKLKDNRLVISSVRSETSKQSDDKKQIYRSEISYGSFSRVIPLPRKVLEDKISATYENGVLTVTAPIDKASPPTDEGRSIKIN